MTGAAAPTPSFDPWTWLVGRTPTGGWRHAPFKAVDPGQGQDPSLEPRVEVVRRLIAYPARAFAAVVAAVAASDVDPRRPVQWVCHRSSGEAPARPYWISFLRAKEPRGRRFFVALELFDRDKLGLWFLSGFRDAAVPMTARAPFPEQPRVSLPRFELGDEGDLGAPAKWVELAFRDQLASFGPMGEATTAFGQAEAPPGGYVDESVVLDSAAAAVAVANAKARASGGMSTGALKIPDAATMDPGREAPPALRSARARLVTCVPGRRPEVVPLARLSTVIGRDPRGDLVIDDRSVSNEHARLGWRDGVPMVEDLGSKNGTRLGRQVVRKAQGPLALDSECYLALGSVGCLFVRDAEDTLPSGPDRRPARQRARLDELVARGRLPREQVDRACAEGRARGITPAEVLVADGAITPEEWTGSPRPTGGGCLPLLAMAVLPLLCGCHSMAFPPLYEQEIDEGVSMREGTREVTWDQDISLRPIFDVRTSEKDDQTEVHWIFPLGKYERKGEDKRVHLYPFYLRDVRVDPDGFKHDTTVCFPPGLFAGTHPVRGDFVYIFPFGGTMYGLFGKESILGVLFPLYAHTEDRGIHTNHVLFPLIAWWSGGDVRGATQTGFRFLPFYGHQEKTTADGVKIFDRHTVLWPFINWVYEGKNSRNPFTSVFIFPFWGRTRSDWRDDDTILWPLFRHVHDKQAHYEEWRAPFPFFVYGTDDGTKDVPPHTRFDVWPLFGVRTRGETYFRQFALWPFERYERQETDEYTDRRFWFVPFVYTLSRTGKDEKQPWTERKTRIWPLVRYERTKEGDVELKALAPILWDDPNLNFDTILDPLYRIFRYASRHDGSSDLQLLLGAFSTRTKADGSSRWDVLGGLFGHGRDAQGKGAVRLFWFLDL